WPAFVSISLRKGVVSFHLWPWSPVMIRTLTSLAGAGPTNARASREARNNSRERMGIPPRWTGGLGVRWRWMIIPGRGRGDKRFSRILVRPGPRPYPGKVRPDPPRRNSPMKVHLLPVVAFLVVALIGKAEERDNTPAPALPQVAVDDWPWWRGPALDGKSRDRQAATRWSTTDNVVWKTPVPGRGHSSPVLWGDRVFLTTAEEDTQTQSVLAFDRKSGKQLWQTPAGKGGFPRKYGKNTHASATPACDGERVLAVFVHHDALHVIATDLAGKVLWQKEV